jgi:uncharacterized membrane protein YeaQ/YmgE (transglycosylase-associated protein family)
MLRNMDISEIAGFAIVGIVAGVLASAAVPDRTPAGTAIAIVTAMIGAALGSRIGAHVFGTASFALLGSIVLGVLGALVVAITPRRRRSTRYHL